MASPTQWTWVWVDSRSWWWTGRPGVLQFMVLQRVGHDWATELNWISKKVSGCVYGDEGAWSSWGRDAVIWRVGRSHKFIPKIEIQINYLTWIWVRSSSESEKVNLFHSCSLLIATAIKFSLLWWLIFNEVSFDDPVYPFIFTVMDTNIKVNQNQGLETTRQKISKGVWWWSSTRI